MKTVLALYFLLVIAQETAAQPAIQFDHQIYDFSVISREDTVEHMFEFANRGDRELVIEQVVPS